MTFFRSFAPALLSLGLVAAAPLAYAAESDGAMMKKDSMKHDSMKHDSMKHDSMKHDSMKGDSMKKDTAN
jgi:pentapeptide MXKDX repeat protein